MQINETLVRNVVEQVLAQVGNPGIANGAGPKKNHFGIFSCANEAVNAARVVQPELLSSN